MKLRCLSIISDYADAFKKGNVYESSTLKADICDVTGDRPKRNGHPWCGVYSLGHIVVLGVAKFEILPEEQSDDESVGNV